MRWSPIRIKIGLLVWILPLFFTLILNLLRLRPRGPQFMGQDIISIFEKKIQPVKLMISGEEAVGYLGDHSDPTSAEQQRDFQFTQYSLAPVMVTDKRATEYFVAVRPLDTVAAESIQKNGLILVKDFGEELRLFKKGSP